MKRFSKSLEWGLACCWSVATNQRQFRHHKRARTSQNAPLKCAAWCAPCRKEAAHWSCDTRRFRLHAEDDHGIERARHEANLVSNVTTKSPSKLVATTNTHWIQTSNAPAKLRPPHHLPRAVPAINSSSELCARQSAAGLRVGRRRWTADPLLRFSRRAGPSRSFSRAAPCPTIVPAWAIIFRGAGVDSHQHNRADELAIPVHLV